MAQQQRSGKPWSGNNPIPNVKQFIDSLDKDKAERDRNIDAQSKPGDGIKPHKNDTRVSNGKTVTDPTTGNQVVIENVGKDYMKAVKDPQLSVPNANLGKPTPVKTDASQSNPEYKENQDITAPPDPIAEGVSIVLTSLNRIVLTTPLPSPPAMFQSEARRQTYFSIPHHLSAMSRCSRRWKSELALSALASWLPSSLLERCLAVL